MLPVVLPPGLLVHTGQPLCCSLPLCRPLVYRMHIPRLLRLTLHRSSEVSIVVFLPPPLSLSLSLSLFLSLSTPVRCDYRIATAAAADLVTVAVFMRGCCRSCACATRTRVHAPLFVPSSACKALDSTELLDSDSRIARVAVPAHALATALCTRP